MFPLDPPVLIVTLLDPTFVELHTPLELVDVLSPKNLTPERNGSFFVLNSSKVGMLLPFRHGFSNSELTWLICY